MMSTTEPLLPCPFCGGCDTEIRRGTKDREGTPTSRVCAGCGADGPWEYEKDDEHTLADAAWNRRTPPAAVPDGWHPIETAPKDGTRVLLLTLEGHISVGAWKTPSNGPWVGVINNGPAYRVWDLGDVIEYRLADLNPTHWQPLPAAPTEASDE